MKRKKVQDKVKAQKVKAPVKNEKTGKKIENEEGTLLFFTMITFSYSAQVPAETRNSYALNETIQIAFRKR
jgi:hypothetical protein